jgi:branched-chain amino acid transport system ATP-binding protein
MSLLRLNRLSKSFGALTATDEVSLTVEPGEIHALIGPNGAGKTTLIAQISGALRPDAGRIFLGEEDITRQPTHARARRGLARSFQLTAVFQPLTALENVALAAQGAAGAAGLRWDGASSAERAARESLDMVGLAPRAGVPAGALAHGEQRALELAMALVQKPRLLLLDEPMAGTGHEEAARLVDLLASLKGTVGMLLVEHDMSAVFKLADWVSVLVAGRIIANAPPDCIRAAPEVRAAYLGETV